MIKNIPFYVKKKKNYTGLCPQHDKGIHFSNELKRLRKIWHVDGCDCAFCSGCQHGANPSGNRQGVSCHSGSCTRCKDSKCPLEWDKNKETVWNEYLHERDQNKRLKITKREELKSNHYISQRLHLELQQFEEHVAHHLLFKDQYTELLNKLKWNHVLVRWDFIGNFFWIFFILIDVTWIK